VELMRLILERDYGMSDRHCHEMYTKLYIQGILVSILNHMVANVAASEHTNTS
jgi:hypothetical protein